jgi:hypothetical protein
MHMHATLRSANNVTLIAVYFFAAVLIAFLAPGSLNWPPIAIGCAVGAWCGVCQRRAIRERASQLLASKTALEVRAALMSSSWGRASVFGLWIGAVAIVIAAVAVSFPNVQEVAASWLLGYLAEKIVREMLTLPSTIGLARLEIAEAPTDAP